ncbi:hypothetical protein EGK_16725 [Macaca mulatta]|uniref:Uncharacterized protein n=1 Tax=Macaca mulatta TaxID=9544 RepID=G7MVH7_MACMU|nr:hypothetical protein EGK_16725 [Macaca mulatta]
MKVFNPISCFHTWDTESLNFPFFWAPTGSSIYTVSSLVGGRLSTEVSRVFTCPSCPVSLAAINFLLLKYLDFGLPIWLPSLVFVSVWF